MEDRWLCASLPIASIKEKLKKYARFPGVARNFTQKPFVENAIKKNMIVVNLALVQSVSVGSLQPDVECVEATTKKR